MESFEKMLVNNKRWVADMLAVDPNYFRQLAGKQQPTSLFIGCSDSRVPANLITVTGPGEMFVHRNIANLVYTADLNLASVLQYAVEVLDVKHVIVCGHFGCGGVKAALEGTNHGIVDFWLTQIRNLSVKYAVQLASLPSEEARLRRLTAMSVLQGIINLASSPIILNNWKRYRRPLLHGLVYDIADGQLRPVAVAVDHLEAVGQLEDLFALTEEVTSR